MTEKRHPEVEPQDVISSGSPVFWGLTHDKENTGY